MDDLSPKRRKIVENLVSVYEQARSLIIDREEVKVSVVANKSTNREAQSEYSVRRSFDSLKLTNSQHQAWLDIEEGLNYLENGGAHVLIGMKTTNLLGVGGGLDLTEEQLENIKKKMGRFNAWEFGLVGEKRRHHSEVVKLMCIPDYTLNRIQIDTGHSREVLSRWFKSGLDYYDELFYRGKK